MAGHGLTERSQTQACGVELPMSAAGDLEVLASSVRRPLADVGMTKHEVPEARRLH